MLKTIINKRGRFGPMDNHMLLLGGITESFEDKIGVHNTLVLSVLSVTYQYASISHLSAVITMHHNMLYYYIYL